ncbi:MAG TPA: hypothetical protein VM143_05655 [Acidimicrobiales bacterium]|nr:hypothetical protein [Acidimicrobiales bacterium]
MIGEFERPARLRLGQDRALVRYLRNQVAPYSRFHQDALGSRPVDGRNALTSLPLVELADVTDPADIVLRPTSDQLAVAPDRELRMQWWWARIRRRTDAFNREVLEPRYKPIHWHAATSESGSVPIGYTAADLERLAEVGRAGLEMAGLTPEDVLVSVFPPGSTLDFWQVHLGARRAGVPSLFLDPSVAPDEVARLRPSVLAGRSGDLIRLLESGRDAGFSFAGLSTLLVIGEPLDPARRARLAEVGGSPSGPVAVVATWAPPGVRALWTECRDGIDVHTWPTAEVVELVDPLSGQPVPPGADGELVWTPVGWMGSVVVRLRTGVFGCIDDTACVSCGRTSPRLRVVDPMPPFARILDDHPGVALWQAELRIHDGAEELIVILAPAVSGHPGRLLRELDRQLSVTQFVVLDRRAMSARLQASGDKRVVDHRA